MNDELPSIAIVSLSYNDAAILEDCLVSIEQQDYPRDKLKVLFADGGSTDGTLEIIRRYGAEVIYRPDLANRADLRVEMMVNAPKADFILVFSADCRFQERDCLREMVAVFSDPEIVGVQTQRYGIRPEDPILSRYLSLIGGVDPIAVGLGKADRTPYDCNSWHSSGNVIDMGAYYKVAFGNDPAVMPAIGANGFMINREYLELVGGMKNGAHVDMCVKLIQQGHNCFAFLKYQHIIHFVHLPLYSFLHRRLAWAHLYAPDKIERIYKVFTPKDWYKLIWIMLTYSTLVVPALRAVRGYLRKPDIAWFLHPVVCFTFFSGYSLSYMKKIFRIGFGTKP